MALIVFVLGCEMIWQTRGDEEARGERSEEERNPPPGNADRLPIDYQSLD